MSIIQKLTSETILDDYIKVDRLTIDAYGQEFERTLVRSKDATALLVRNTDTGLFYFVKQLRSCKIHESDPTTIEVVAGLLEAGEDIYEGARRECLEEIGVRATDMSYFGASYSGPGMMSEKIHYFYAEITNSDVVSDGGGIENESENITIITFTEQEMLERLEQHQWEDTKTVVLVQRYFMDKWSPKGLRKR